MKRIFVIVAVAVVLFAVNGSAEAPPPLRLVQRIQMPKGFQHFDHFGVDYKGKRLFATFEDHNTVEVFDLVTGKQIQSIEGFKAPHNVLYLQDLNEVVITDGGGSCTFLRGDTLKPLHTVKLQLNADFVGYDPKTHSFYVTNGGHVAGMKYALISVINEHGEHVKDIRVDGVHIEFMTLEPSGERIFVNIADRNAIGVINRQTGETISTWMLHDAEDNIPLALDEGHHRLFTVSRKPAQMIVFDTESGKPVATLPSAGDADDMSYDSQRQRVYVSGGEGYISVFKQQDGDHYQSATKVSSGPGGKTSIFVPELNRFYVGVRGKEAAELQVFEVQP